MENLQAYDAVSEKGYPSICSVQNGFNIVVGEVGAMLSASGVLDYCARTGKSYIAHGPLSKGLLTDRYLDRSKVGKGDRLFDEGILDEKLIPENGHKLQALAGLARQWDMEVSQLTLAYTLTLPGMGPAIPAASTVDQLESNAKVGTIELSEEQTAQIREILT